MQSKLFLSSLASIKFLFEVFSFYCSTYFHSPFLHFILSFKNVWITIHSRTTLLHKKVDQLQLCTMNIKSCELLKYNIQCYCSLH